MPLAARTTAEDLLATASLLVVPSDAAAQQRRALHDRQQRQSGNKAWSPANVLTWDQWLRSMWSQTITDGLELRLLLNASQEHRLWCQVVRSHRSTEDTLRSVEALAELAQSAWKLSESYRATSRLRKAAATHDARVFAEWADTFAERCRAQGLVSRAGLEAALEARVTAREITPPQQLITLAGFLRWTPAQTRFLAAMRNAGATLSESSLDARDDRGSERILLATDTEEAELGAIATQARELLTASGGATTIAVLIPDLASVQPSVERIFRNILTPELQDITAPEALPPFEFARSQPLANEPMIAAALDLALWLSGPLSLTAIGALLLSPYVAPACDLEQRAHFDATQLRTAQRLRPEADLRLLASEAHRSPYSTSLAWIASLARFTEEEKSLDAPRGFAQWMELIRQALRAAGWCSGPLPSTHEQALERAWEHALDTVATLDFAGERVSYNEALAALKHQLSGTMLPSSQRAPIQILTPADATGMAFNSVLFARATDVNWPTLPQRNPLINPQLQSALHMPGTDRLNDINHARSELNALVDSASFISFSYSRSTAEGPQRLSPLIAELQIEVQTAAELNLATAEPAFQEPDQIVDDSALTPLASSQVHGGATVLQLQAACGFRAFAEMRLRSVGPETRDLGHDARDRGNLLHEVMQRFWKEVRTLRALKAMPSEEQQNVLKRCIEDAFTKRTRAETTWDDAYIVLQKERLRRLLTAWLQSESERADFEVISAEEKKNIRVGPLDLTLRVDRIDLVEDGEFLVDYKTGSSAMPANWDGERPDEPQLPLYALLARERPLVGLAFAKVRPGKTMGWLGYASQAGVIPGKNVVRELPNLHDEWKVNLEALANSFAEGDISVAPKTYPVTCSWCSQRLLCRLDAATLLDTEDPLEVSEDESIA